MFLNTERYKIFFEKPELAYLSEFLESQVKIEDVLVFTDENTQKACLPLLMPMLGRFRVDQICIPAGEAHKNINTVLSVWKEMMDRQIRRNTLVINLGGGVLTDFGGFAASVFKRGLPFIQVPTSLLGMLDASVGSKTGVDFMGHKNMLGTFSDPVAVFVAPKFLETLSADHIRAGMAEAWKHALIDNAGYWNYLKQYGMANFDRLIFKSLEIKRKIVSRDPHENGERKKLNFGHTVAHALESWHLQAGEAPILHGDAVAAGMIAESYISWKMGKLEKVVFDEIRETLLPLFPHMKLPLEEIPRLMEYMENDKKNTQKGLSFVLLEDIGDAVFNQQVASQVVEDSLAYYMSLNP